MLNIFTLVNGRLFQEEIESLEELSKFQPIWVDLESPTPEEKRWIKQYYGLSIPEDVMDEDIEESARFYEEDNGELHLERGGQVLEHLLLVNRLDAGQYIFVVPAFQEEVLQLTGCGSVHIRSTCISGRGSAVDWVRVSTYS